MKIMMPLDPATEGQSITVYAWQCEGCKMSGVVHPKDLQGQDVWRVQHIVEDQHKLLAPACKSIRQFPAPDTISKEMMIKAGYILTRGEARRLIGDLITQIEKNGGSIQRDIGVKILRRVRHYLLKTECD
jgi:hypothetical protein